ncbi:hypothetical protein ACS77_02065 [Pseudomonas syringae]|uniref:Uncharacterized protein n=1 Tax=Pseudomonas syringae TaxID=317 RepID=A0A0L1MMM5_PSESX|nr:hypothetical protein ACS77_02065 [Pseudomonas syringae]
MQISSTSDRVSSIPGRRTSEHLSCLSNKQRSRQWFAVPSDVKSKESTDIDFHSLDVRSAMLGLTSKRELATLTWHQTAFA